MNLLHTPRASPVSAPLLRRRNSFVNFNATKVIMANNDFDLDEVGLDPTDEPDEWSPNSITRKQVKIVTSVLADNLRINLLSAGDKEEFLAENEACFTGGNDGTILHAVIREYYTVYGRDEDKLNRVKPLLRLILGKYPALLESRSPMGETTLHFAIRKRLSQMTKYLCICASPRAATALEARGVRNRTCLHAAIHHELGLDTITYLISICRPALLLCADESGDTPLHLVVRYPDPRPKIRTVVVDKTSDDLQRESTREEKGPADFQHISGDDRSERSRPLTGTTIPSVRKGQDETGSSDILLGFIQRILPAIASDIPYSSPYGLDLVKNLIQKNDSALDIKNQHGRTPYQERVYQLSKFTARKPPTAGDKPKESWGMADSHLQSEKSDNTARYMVEYCVRKFSQDRVFGCLYEPGQERHIAFDLSTLRQQSITSDYLRRLSMHVKFESVLKYVALPRLKVVMDPGTPYSVGGKSTASRGRSDLLLVFEWLRRQGVKTILKVIVADDQDAAHSDAAIEAALRGFGVEIWDWKRLDLSADVISTCTPKAKEIFLYSSGNNAVLSGWASPHTLSDRSKFPEGLEETARLMAYVEQFKANIRKQSNNRIHVSHYMWDTKTKNEIVSKNGMNTGDVSWHDCVSTFSRLLKTMPKQKKKGTVKIAILDDGIDMLWDGLNVSIGDGASFDGHDSAASPWFISSSASNHGTYMAALISNLCPESQLYIAKITEAAENGEKAATAESAARAIEWSVNRQVDIICMGSSIASHECGGKERLANAIQQVDERGIIMFTSAPEFESPGESACAVRSQKCLAIGACTSTGEPLWATTLGMANFLVPGKDVVIPGHGDGLRRVTGSSFAAAAACGLAGVLILCLRYISWPVDVRLVHRTFKALAEEDKFVKVDEFFGSGFRKQLERAHRGAVVSLESERLQQTLDLSAMTWDKSCMDALRAMFERLLVLRPEAENLSRLDFTA